MRLPEHSIFTYTGTRFWPLEPKAEEINVVDIAHALSQQCRFTGHTKTFYSVAQHSVLVSKNVPDTDALWGLLHDATEAYLIDLARPVKAQMPEYQAVEDRLMECVAAAFKLPWPMPKSVKVADNVLLVTEKRDLLAGNPTFSQTYTQGVEPLVQSIVPWSPAEAEVAFLNRFRELTEPVPAQFRSCVGGSCGWERDLAALSTIRIADDFANRKEI